MMYTRQAKLFIVFYFAIFFWWIILAFLGVKGTLTNYLYQLAFALIPFIGGILGIRRAKKWGLFTSAVGKSLFFISAGLISWGVGQIAWSYYNIFLKIEIPYPSLADFGYIVAVPLWAVGIAFLSKATGANITAHKKRGKVLLSIIPLGVSVLSYYLLFLTARNGVISTDDGVWKFVFDLAYPLGDLAILTISLLIYGLSLNYLGGKLRMPILSIIIGFVVLYVTDFSFSYATTIGTYYNGHWVDLLFPTAMLLVTLGVCDFDTKIDAKS